MGSVSTLDLVAVAMMISQTFRPRDEPKIFSDSSRRPEYGYLSCVIVDVDQVFTTIDSSTRSQVFPVKVIRAIKRSPESSLKAY
jgi:hypothetical protein